MYKKIYNMLANCLISVLFDFERKFRDANVNKKEIHLTNKNAAYALITCILFIEIVYKYFEWF